MRLSPATAALLRRPTLIFGATVLGIIALAALLAPLVAPYDPRALAISHRLQPPSVRWLFGTDEYGRDILSRSIWAGRISLAVGAGTALLSGAVGLVLGLFAGTFRRLDAPLSRLIDAMLAFPDILLAIALVAALGGSVGNVIIALGIVYTPRIARIARASALVIRELPYVEAAIALGIPKGRILIRHVLLNMASPVIVQATFIFANAMLSEAALSFLGAGVDPDTPTWGAMINAGRQYVDKAGWMILFPGLAIVLAVLSLQLVGDALRDALDPRLAKDI